MRNQSSGLLLVALLAFALAAALPGCGGDTGPSPSSTPVPGGAGGPASPSGGLAAGSSQDRLAPLGITGRPSGTQPQGLLVTGFTSSPNQSPLEVIGVKKGDVIISCNEGQEQISARCLAAIKGLQERGEPITLGVIRDGKRVELKRSEKLPEAAASEAEE